MTARDPTIAKLLLAILGATSIDAQADVSFLPLGDLPGGSYYSVAHDVSADGSVVVGRSSIGDTSHGFRWTAETGMVDLGDLLGGIDYSDAYAVSADGTTVVGRSSSQYSSEGDKEAFRWTAEGGMDGIGDLWGGPFSSEANHVSADGSVVVGTGSRGGVGVQPREAFRWTEETGMDGIGGLFPGWDAGSAFACSADGSVIVGRSMNTSGNQEAFRWTEETGPVGLGDLAGGDCASSAEAVSADGSVVVGQSNVGHDELGRLLREVFRWTEETGMVGLGFYGGLVYDCSADASVIVSDLFNVPWVYDPVHGVRDLADVLTAGGVDLTGWTLWRASGVSADGNTIVGCAYNPDGYLEAYVAHIPEPTTLGLLGVGTAMVWNRRRK